MKNTYAQIEQCFQDAWEEFGDDASTEFLIAITSDRMGVSYDRVVSAIVSINAEEKAND